MCGFVGTDDCYAPTDVEFMHGLHGSDNCGMHCQLRYEVRPYGHYAPTDVEFYHEMHGPDNCGEHCVSRSRAGVTSGVEECDVYAGDVDLLRRGSDKQQCCIFSNVVCASPTGPGGSGNEDSDICDIGDICEKVVSDVPRVPGVPDVSHGSENCTIGV